MAVVPVPNSTWKRTFELVLYVVDPPVIILTFSGLCLSIQLPSLYLRMLIIKNHSFMISRPEDLTTNPADHKQSPSNCNTRGTDWNGNSSSQRRTTGCTTGRDAAFRDLHHFTRTPWLSVYRRMWNPLHQPPMGTTDTCTPTSPAWYPQASLTSTWKGFCPSTQPEKELTFRVQLLFSSRYQDPPHHSGK